MSQQPEALRLAEALEKMPGYDWNKNYCEAAFELRRLHAKLEYANQVIDQRNAMVTAANAHVRRLQAAQALPAVEVAQCGDDDGDITGVAGPLPETGWD